MKQRTKALLAAVISGAAFAGLVGGLIFWLPSYKEKKEMEAIKPVETAAPIVEKPRPPLTPAAEEARPAGQIRRPHRPQLRVRRLDRDPRRGH